MDARFYTFGRGLAPRQWRLNALPYTNRLYVIYGGRGAFLSEEGPVPLRPGWVYLFPHRLPFRVTQDPEQPVDHLYFDFTLSPPLTGSRLAEIPFSPDSLMGRTVSCLETAVERGGEELVTAYFWCLLRLALEEAPFLAPGDQRLAPALECIHRRFGEKLTLETLAALTHLEKNHFIRVFRRAMGITPYQYLRQVRLNRAASLLRRGQSVSGAAAACGFESAAALSHAMRKSRSVSPGEIRGME